MSLRPIDFPLVAQISFVSLHRLWGTGVTCGRAPTALRPKSENLRSFGLGLIDPNEQTILVIARHCAASPRPRPDVRPARDRLLRACLTGGNNEAWAASFSTSTCTTRHVGNGAACSSGCASRYARCARRVASS